MAPTDRVVKQSMPKDVAARRMTTLFLVNFFVYALVAVGGVVLVVCSQGIGWAVIGAALGLSATRGFKIWLRLRNDRRVREAAAWRAAVGEEAPVVPVELRQRRLRLLSLTYITTFVILAIVAAAISPVLPEELRLTARAIAGVLIAAAVMVGVMWLLASRKLSRGA